MRLRGSANARQLTGASEFAALSGLRHAQADQAGGIKAGAQQRRTPNSRLRDSSLFWVHRLGAAQLACLLLLGLGLLAAASALIHPLVSLLFLPVALLAPWIWWRGELQSLGAALRDHPGVCFAGQTSWIPSLLYPPLCLLIFAAGISAVGAAGYAVWQYAVALFSSQSGGPI